MLAHLRSFKHHLCPSVLPGAPPWTSLQKKPGSLVATHVSLRSYRCALVRTGTHSLPCGLPGGKRFRGKKGEGTCPKAHGQKGWNLLRMVLVLCFLVFCFFFFFFSFVLRAWPKASKHKFRSFSCKSAFVFLSTRNTAPRVSGPVYSTCKTT